MMKKHYSRGHNFGILGGFKTEEPAEEKLKVGEEIGVVIEGLVIEMIAEKLESVHKWLD